jgi:hypothetical protein
MKKSSLVQIRFSNDPQKTPTLDELKAIPEALLNQRG